VPWYGRKGFTVAVSALEIHESSQEAMEVTRFASKMHFLSADGLVQEGMQQHVTAKRHTQVIQTATKRP